MQLRMAFATVIGAGLLGAIFGGTEPRAQAPAATPTFSKDVAPILFKSCASCHRPGGLGPMPLMTFDQARPYARSIRAKVVDGSMPPWHAEAPEGTFLNDRRLSEEEQETIVAWVANGSPQGNPADLPAAPTFPDGWTIGKPDAVLAMATEYNVPPSGEIEYQYFEVPTNFTQDRWIQAIEIMPGALSVVHHVLVFSREPDGAVRPKPPYITRQVPGAAAAAPRGDGDASGRPAGASAQYRGNLIATTAPGTNAQVFPPGQGMLIKAGSVLTFQVHYTATGAPAKDRSSIGFVFAKGKPALEVQSGAIINASFVIPAGAAKHAVDSIAEFTEDTTILALFPHTHLRGKSWEYKLTYPDGRSDVVLSVPNYDFNWQTYYEFAKPLHAPKGSKLEARATYDNSLGNRSNPDATLDVRWGEQTWEEMQYTGITFIVDRPGAGRSQAQP